MTHPQANSQSASQGVARASGVGRHLPKSKGSKPAASGAKKTNGSRKVASKASAVRASSAATRAADVEPAALASLPDEELLETVQRQHFRYFWEGAHPDSGLVFDRRTSGKPAAVDAWITVGGSGFGVMVLIVAVERGWVTRGAALERLGRMLDLLTRARRYHGAYPAFHERPHGRNQPVLGEGRRGGPRRDVVPDDGSALRASVLRSRHARRSGGAIANLEPVERSGVELVHARRARGALLALEPDARLGHESPDSRLERVPDHVRARGCVADSRDRARGLHPRFRERSGVS